ncbi:MAG: sodium:solute symporter family protein, partial [Polyangiaceae bacterium]
ILATMPYIALQLVGIQVVIAGLGFQGTGIWAEMPLFVAFLILAAYTYSSGLRAPAMIAVVKDAIIYITVIAAVVIIPMKLGGYGKIFAAVPPEKLIFAAPKNGNLGAYTAYPTLAFGSAIALFFYPHSVTGVLSSNSRDVIRRNTALLPAYSFLLGLIALLGYMALAAGVAKKPEYAELFKEYGANFAVPALFLDSFPSWFVGFSFAAIAIGALVPAAIMSIAAANLFTRNIYKEFIVKSPTEKEESQVAKIASLVVKFGALAFILFVPQKYAIQLQLLGGVWMLQTFPAIAIGLYSRWFHRHALLAGWALGMISGTWMCKTLAFKSTTFALHVGGLTIPGYAALWAVLLNLLVAAIGTLAFNAANVDAGEDATSEDDFEADAA